MPPVRREPRAVPGALPQGPPASGDRILAGSRGARTPGKAPECLAWKVTCAPLATWVALGQRPRRVMGPGSPAAGGHTAGPARGRDALTWAPRGPAGPLGRAALSPQAAGARYSRERLPLPRAVRVCRRPAGRSHSAPSALGRSRRGDRRGTPSDSRGSRAPAQGGVPAGALRLPACGRCGCGSPPAGSSGVYLTPQRAMVQLREP